MSRALAVAFVAALGVAAPADAASPPELQRLAELLGDRAAHTAPRSASREITTVSARRPLTGVRTVLPVIRSAGGGAWLHVRLPGRPSGRTGWIAAGGTRRTSTEWHIVVRLATRRVTVYRDGRVERSFRAVIGARATPTPVGRSFVEEAVRLSPGASGAPYALATGARSSVLQSFAGGPGQIALHGVGNLPGTLGTASSHGCIRLSGRAITWLAHRIGSGVPVTVVR